MLIWRIRSRVSELTLGRPTERDLDPPRQYSRKPLRCHWITVAGFTSTMAFKARESGKATSRAVGLQRRSEADLGAAGAARRVDVEGRRAQVRVRRGDESGKRVRKGERK